VMSIASADVDSFRFLWFRFPYLLAPLKIVKHGEQPTMPEPNLLTRKIAMMSSLTRDGEAIPGGVATNMWAFMTLSGQWVFCVVTESASPNLESQQTFYFRGDNQSVLFSLVGSKMT
jgi:hypothetical protein